jgi:Ca2+-binding EF-hand superfamily protein
VCAQNGSGTIEDDELENIGYELGEPLSMAELLMVFTLLDHNSDGSIEFRHFTDVRCVAWCGVGWGDIAYGL